MAREQIAPVSLNRARNRRMLVQGSMRSDAIIIAGVGDFCRPASRSHHNFAAGAVYLIGVGLGISIRIGTHCI
jgi:hypothetical protein